jgi:hypothetical protein
MYVIVDFKGFIEVDAPHPDAAGDLVERRIDDAIRTIVEQRRVSHHDLKIEVAQRPEV